MEPDNPLLPPDALLIADDLTGACDATVHFANRGRKTAVYLALPREVATAEVIGITTDSREAGKGAFQARLTKVADWLSARGSSGILFKKIDSTLRGNVGQEIAATLTMFSCDVAIVCSAFPAHNRVVEQGTLRITGDENFPGIGVLELLRQQGLDRCVHVRAGTLRNAVLAGARIVSLDAASDGNLDEIAAEASMLEERILWVGSGGLAAALARTLAPRLLDSPATLTRNGPVLFCIGSSHRVTLAQQAALFAMRDVQMVLWEDARREDILNSMRSQRHVCLQILPGAAFAEKVHELIGGATASAIVLSGGDTASLVCQAVGVRSIELRGEVAPGIPYGVLQGGELDGMAVVTKSGAFGPVDALIEIADYFLCSNQ